MCDAGKCCTAAGGSRVLARIFGEFGREMDVCDGIDALYWYDGGIWSAFGFSMGNAFKFAANLRLRLSVRWFGIGLWAVFL